MANTVNFIVSLFIIEIVMQVPPRFCTQVYCATNATTQKTTTTVVELEEFDGAKKIKYCC